MSLISYEKKASAAKDHGKNNVKIRPSFVHHLLRNRLFRSCNHSVDYSLSRGRGRGKTTPRSTEEYFDARPENKTGLSTEDFL